MDEGTERSRQRRGRIDSDIRVEVRYSCILAMWERNKFMPRAFDDGERN